MKKKTPPYFLVGAILLFLVAAFSLYEWNISKDRAAADALAQQKAAEDAELEAAKEKQVIVQPTQTNERMVLYALQPIEPGTRISPGFYEKKLTPTDILPDAYSDKDDITGWVAVRHVEKGDPLTPHNIGKNMPSMASRLTPGMRALALPIFNAELNETGGFIVDGDRVDLLYTVGASDDDRVNTQTILQNIKVLYVPGPPQRSDQTEGVVPATAPGENLSVTFEVTPEEAQELIYLTSAPHVGKFSMILRSTKDDSEIKVKPFNIADFDQSNLRKIQTLADKSVERVRQLSAEISAKEKEAQGNPNETNTPPASP